MKIAVVAHIRHPIAEPFMGGMEAHCHQLIGALTTRGNDVTLFAAEGSDLRYTRPICDQPYESVLPWDVWGGSDRLTTYQHEAFSRAWEAISAGAFDIVHNNSLFTPILDWATAERQPMVTSQHVPPFAAMRDTVRANAACPWQRVTVTSRHQLSLWTNCPTDRLQVVHNGIDTSCWSVAESRGSRLIWFGRITPNKGVREAAQAARIAGMNLDIVGTIEHNDYFGRHVAPFLGEAIRYLGHKSGADLRDHVSRALAAVVTPLWDEPFGMVAAEAMSCGVPVIAFDRGAMREVLGPCGHLVPAGDIEALAAAMAQADILDGGMCRQRVETQFSVANMLDGYEDCYHQAIAGAQATDWASRASNSSSTVDELA